MLAQSAISGANLFGVWRWAVLASTALSIAACGSSHHAARASDVIAGGCGRTDVHRGHPPAWTASAFSDSSPGFISNYSLSDGRNAAAVLFAFPLRPGNPSNPANKVLWIMRLPRNGSSLVIDLTPLGASRPHVRVVAPDDAEPGEIYPSYVNVPAAGCWRATLRWARHTDTIDLLYRT